VIVGDLNQPDHVKEANVFVVEPAKIELRLMPPNQPRCVLPNCAQMQL